jgi:hypothetical protein
MNKELKPAITIVNESLDFASVFDSIDDYDFDDMSSDDAMLIIDSLLKNSNVNYHTRFASYGNGVSENFQDSSDSFIVTFEEINQKGDVMSLTSIPYYMGIGNRKKEAVELIDKKTEELVDAGFKIAMSQTITKNKKILTARDKANKEFTETFCEFVLMPRAANVLYSLVMDVDYANMSFNEFCDELGYNNDSIKDRELHDKIKENGATVRSVFGKSGIAVLEKVLGNY